jgi:WD40 repeat protein
MAESFDPYRKWLGIPPEEQPPNHYRLLGVGLFEVDGDVIQEAADRQMAHVQRHKLGNYAALSQKMLNELAAAKICLLKPDRKAAYDAELRQQLSAKSESIPPPPGIGAVAAAPVAGLPPAPSAMPAAAPSAPDSTFDFVDADAAGRAQLRGAPSGSRSAIGRAQGKSSAGKSAASKSLPGKTRAANKSSFNPILVGGGVAAAVALMAIVGLLMNHGTPQVPVAQKPAARVPRESSTPETNSNRPAAAAGEETSGSAATEHVDEEPEQGAEARTPAERETPAENPAPREVDTEHPPAATAESSPGTAGVLESADVLDLLPLIKVNNNTAAGKWQKSKKGLVLFASENSFPRVLIPYAPPNEYQLELIVEPQRDCELRLGLVAGGKQFIAIIDGWGGSKSGLHLLAGAPGNENASTHQGEVMRARRPNRLLATVRGDSITINCDEQPAIAWRGAFDQLSSDPTLSVSEKRGLFLAGSQGSAFRVRSMRLATLSGRGEELTAPVVANPEVARIETPAEAPEAAPPNTAAPDDGFTLAGAQTPIRGIAVSPDSKHAVTVTGKLGAGRRSIFAWDLEQRRLDRADFASVAEYNAVAYSGDGQRLYLVTRSGHLSYHQINMSGMFDMGAQFAGNLYCVAATPDNSGVVVGGDNGLAVFKPSANSNVFQWSNPDRIPVSAVAVSADGSRLWAGCGANWNGPRPEGGSDHKLHLWDGPTRRVVELKGHRGAIWGIALSADGSRVVTASEDSTLRVWDGKALKSQRVLTGHEGPVYCVALSPDGAYALSGGSDKTVRLWNATTGAELKRFEGHTAAVNAVALTPNGKFALSGGEEADGLVRVWDLKLPARRPTRVASKPKPTSDRTAVPGKDELEAATKLIRDIFADDYKQAKKGADKIALAEKLLKQSTESQNDAERFALLSEARALAGAGSSPSLAIQIIEQTGNRYQIDVPRETVEFVEQLPNSLPAATRHEVTEALLPLAEAGLERGDFETARRLLAAAAQSARKANDPALVKQVAGRVAEANDGKKSLEAYQKALASLQSSPDDGDAHLAAGRYLCFVKNDWDGGLGHLAKASDPTFKEIAELELKAPTSPEDQVKLGDLWWTLQETAKGKDKTDYAERSDKWYSTALPGLKGLSQTKVSKRIEELASLTKAAGSPSASGGERPAVAAGAATATPKSIAARLKAALKKDSLVRSQVAGGGVGTAYFEVPPAGAVLAGLNVTFRGQNSYLTSIQAIYWGPRGIVPGEVAGNASGPPTTLVAKKGYAVAGIRVSADYDIWGMQLIFAKLTEKGLDLSDKYTSDWVGSQNYTERTVGDNSNQAAIGIFGTGNRNGVTGIGLVQLPAE